MLHSHYIKASVGTGKKSGNPTLTDPVTLGFSIPACAVMRTLCWQGCFED